MPQSSKKSSARKLNVALMTDVTGRGGAEKALVDLALGIDRSRYNVVVIATRYAGNYQPALDAAGVKTIILNRTSSKQIYKMFGLARLLRQKRIDVLHAHLFGANTWARILGKIAGTPVVIAHEHWSSKAQKEVWVDRLLYRLSDLIIVPSNASKQLVMDMEGTPASKLSVVYNGVDINRFKPGEIDRLARSEFGFSADDLVVGLVGRLSPDKGGQAPLLRGFAAAREKYPQLKLLVVGDGPLRPELEALAAELNLGGAAVFAGQRVDIPQMLAAMDVFVLPSLMEALPIAVLEAMAMRLPVVATNVGGVPEVVLPGETGLLVPPDDAPAIQGALEKLAADPALRQRLGSAGQARVLDCFTLAKMVDSVEKIYDGLYMRKMRNA